MPVYSKQPAVLYTISPDCINDHFLWFGLIWVTEGFETNSNNLQDFCHMHVVVMTIIDTDLDTCIRYLIGSVLPCSYWE